MPVKLMAHMTNKVSYNHMATLYTVIFRATAPLLVVFAFRICTNKDDVALFITSYQEFEASVENGWYRLLAKPIALAVCCVI